MAGATRMMPLAASRREKLGDGRFSHRLGKDEDVKTEN